MRSGRTVTRRGFLATVASVSVISGCLGGSEDDEGDQGGEEDGNNQNINQENRDGSKDNAEFLFKFSPTVSLIPKS